MLRLSYCCTLRIWELTLGEAIWLYVKIEQILTLVWYYLLILILIKSEATICY